MFQVYLAREARKYKLQRVVWCIDVSWKIFCPIYPTGRLATLTKIVWARKREHNRQQTWSLYIFLIYRTYVHLLAVSLTFALLHASHAFRFSAHLTAFSVKLGDAANVLSFGLTISFFAKACVCFFVAADAAGVWDDTAAAALAVCSISHWMCRRNHRYRACRSFCYSIVD